MRNAYELVNSRMRLNKKICLYSNEIIYMVHMCKTDKYCAYFGFND